MNCVLLLLLYYIVNEKESNEESEGDTKPASMKGKKQENKWNWKKDFMEMIKNMAGLVKLSAEHPSTAAIGNWGIIEAVKGLAEDRNFGTCISARLFMGKKKTAKSKLIEVPISRKDTDEQISRQWDEMR